jgi:TPR repeat protein
VSATGVSAQGTGEANMADCEANGVDAPISANASCETFYEHGLMHASGRSGATDLVSAHKWFNIAAMKGHVDAARMRREIAAEMSDAEIGQAQRAARDWLKSQPAVEEPQAEIPQYRAAA